MQDCCDGLQDSSWVGPPGTGVPHPPRHSPPTSLSQSPERALHSANSDPLVSRRGNLQTKKGGGSRSFLAAAPLIWNPSPLEFHALQLFRPNLNTSLVILKDQDVIEVKAVEATTTISSSPTHSNLRQIPQLLRRRHAANLQGLLWQ